MGLPCGAYNTTYAREMAIIRTGTQWGLAIAGVAFVFCFPQFLSESWLNILNFTCITMIAIFGLSITTGYAGQINIGQAAFMGVGAYTSAVLTTNFGLSFWAAIPCAGIMAGLVGLIFGAPSLKVKGLYLALATLAAQFILCWIFKHWAYLGAHAGTAAPYPSIAGITIRSTTAFYYLIIGFAFVMGILAKNIGRTRAGRAFITIRDNDLAAEGIGVNVYNYKLLAFFIGCFYAGIAGSLLASYTGWANYDFYTLDDSIWMLGILVVGGMGGIMGAVFGTLFIKIIEQVTQMYVPLTGLAPMATAFIGYIVFGAIVVLFLIFEPRGLHHRWEVFKASYRLWPFSYYLRL